jgi:biopolymer transport protein ExbD
MARREIPEINAGSMADIAFLLLIFFLVTTTMEKESGMMRLLPEINQPNPEEVNKRNVIDVLVNDQNKILLKGELISITDITKTVSELILNEGDNKNWPQNLKVSTEELQGLLKSATDAYNAADPSTEKALKKALKKAELRVKALGIFGEDFKRSKHVISIQSTRGADYKTYIELSDQLLLAYKNMKDKTAKKKWNKTYSELNKEEQEMLNIMFPANISEAQTVQGVN